MTPVHLIVVKTWMKTKERRKTICIFEVFDIEGLIDTLHTMLKKGKILMSDYRMWFKLNYSTRISILTPVGQTDGATKSNGIGKGSFAAA